MLPELFSKLLQTNGFKFSFFTKFTFLKPQFSQHLGNLTVWCLSFPPDLFNFLIWKGLVVLILLIYFGFFWHFLKILTIQLCLFSAFWRVFFSIIWKNTLFSVVWQVFPSISISHLLTFVYFQRFDEFFFNNLKEYIIIFKITRKILKTDLNYALLRKILKINTYSNLPNKRTSTITEFWEKNLDQCFVIIFEQKKLFQLIAFIPGALYKVKPGIKSINWNNFHWPKIVATHRSRFFLKIW